MTGEEKLTALHLWLKENKIFHKKDVKFENCAFVYDLFIFDYYISVRISTIEEEDRKFYKEANRHSFPVFIRETDSPEFVIEKVKNTIEKAKRQKERHEINKKQKEINISKNEELRLKAEQRRAERAAQKKAAEEAKPKRKRQRIMKAEVAYKS